MFYVKIFFLSKISKYFPPPHVGWHLFYLICGQSWLLLSTRLPNNSTTWQSFLATIIFTNNHTIQMSEKKTFLGRGSHREGFKNPVYGRKNWCEKINCGFCREKKVFRPIFNKKTDGGGDNPPPFTDDFFLKN